MWLPQLVRNFSSRLTASPASDAKVKTTFGTMSSPSMNRYTLKSVRLSGAKLRIIE